MKGVHGGDCPRGNRQYIWTPSFSSYTFLALSTFRFIELLFSFECIYLPLNPCSTFLSHAAHRMNHTCIHIREWFNQMCMVNYLKVGLDWLWSILWAKFVMKTNEKRTKKGARIFPFSNVFVFKRLNACTNTNITFYELQKVHCLFIGGRSMCFQEKIIFEWRFQNCIQVGFAGFPHA